MEELPSLENETRQRSPSLPLVTPLKQSPVGLDPIDGAYVHPQQHRSCSGGAILFGFPDPAEMEFFFARQLRTAQNGFVSAGPKDGLELSTTISGWLGDMAEAPQVGCGKNWLDMMRFQYWFVVLGICPATATGNFHAIEG